MKSERYMIKDKDRIIELVILLNKYRDAYYNNNNSLITDKEYDNLYDELVKLEKEQGLVLANSPTRTVGYEVVSELKKVKHNHPLLSLDKTTDIEEFRTFFNGKPTLLMAKMDGLTCSLFYKDGKLIRAESRGDGEIGEDITHNAKTFINVPMEIPIKGEMIIDGECVITYDDFNAINQREDNKYKNPRNLVSGSVRQLNSEITKARNVRFVVWKVFDVKNESGISILPNSHHNNLLNIKNLGFDIVPHIYIDKNTIKDYSEGIDRIKDICQKESYPIDGIVGMFDNVDYGLSLGMTDHHPRHSIAFKFYQELYDTRLLEIEWNTTRTGVVNPVAIFEPVIIDGCSVSRASLNNLSYIKEKLGKPYVGQRLKVYKANAIIPCIHSAEILKEDFV